MVSSLYRLKVLHLGHLISSLLPSPTLARSLWQNLHLNSLNICLSPLLYRILYQEISHYLKIGLAAFRLSCTAAKYSCKTASFVPCSASNTFFSRPGNSNFFTINGNLCPWI